MTLTMMVLKAQNSRPFFEDLPRFKQFYCHGLLQPEINTACTMSQQIDTLS